ncbi:MULTISPECIES: hypothetical protein [unclassified Bradyrhizobium]|uniref:hypothetical protein n=1 Tax=Bradyrhizobium sp. USDA 4541 TaxID=2817704 RepID=UPI0020A5016B|nr:hypothetical protein [Bradyrhizobium sp. USDA 4541]MCP1850259.1 hypothetical protein [Bradyrhizobium sp. USDA 4541]
MIKAQTISIWRDEEADGGMPSQQLVKALADVAKSGATRQLIRKGEDRNVECELRVPLLQDCYVHSDELGRVLRTVCRAAIEAGQAGDHFIIDLHVGPDSLLVVQAKRANPQLEQRSRN